MEQHVYKVVEIVGAAQGSIEDAIRNGVGRAAESLRNIGWFEVVQVRGHVSGGRIDQYQVTMKIGFTLEGSGNE